MLIIEQLRSAFAKIVIQYRNEKLPKKVSVSTEDSYLNASGLLLVINDCIREVQLVEVSKHLHLNLFKELFQAINTLILYGTPKDDGREALKDELIAAMVSLHELNHTGRTVKIHFNEMDYQLTTTVGHWGWSGLTDLGHLIRECLLKPLGASGTTGGSLSVEENIATKINSMFSDLQKKEAQELAQKSIDALIAKSKVIEAKLERTKNGEPDDSPISDSLRSSPHALNGLSLFDKKKTVPATTEIVKTEQPAI
jgi:carbon monoxide dehydrogenase subunit G